MRGRRIAGSNVTWALVNKYLVPATSATVLLLLWFRGQAGACGVFARERELGVLLEQSPLAVNRCPAARERNCGLIQNSL
jgi:hypothetical protein